MSRFVHKWLSLVVALQVVIWIGTGLYFNLVSPEWHDSNLYRTQADTLRCTDSVVPVSTLDNLQQPVVIELLPTANGCLYIAHQNRVFHHYQPMQVQIYDANTGKLAEPLTAAQASALATQSYSGPGQIVSAVRLPAGQSSNKKQLNPVWQVHFDDDVKTKVYIHTVTRSVTRHENQGSRFHQLMFTLHFMDYFGTGSFHHPLIIITGLLTLLFFVSGLFWLIEKIKKGRL